VRPFTLQEAASAAGARLSGDADLVLKSVAPLADAGPDDLSFVSGARYRAAARDSRAGALIVGDAADAGGKPALIASNPSVALARLLDYLEPARKAAPGVSSRAVVSPTARLGTEVAIGPGAVIGERAEIGDRAVIGVNAYVGPDAQIGRDTILFTGAVVEWGCRVGERCRIFPGAVIGSDGFGYVWDGERHLRIPQIGVAVLEDDVDVGANACVDRAALSETRVGRGTKIDNLVQVGHNARIGEHSILCGQAGLAGSVRVGRRVTIAGQVGIGDRMTVGDGATCTAQAGVMSNVEPGQVVSGMPAEPHREFLKREAAADRLPEALSRLAELERKFTAKFEAL